MSTPKTDTPKPATGLYGKLLAAQSTASTVTKDGRNEAQGYSYAQASDVIEEAQRALHEAQLVGFMVPGEPQSREVESSGGTAGLFVTITSTLTIIDPDTPGDRLEVTCLGTGVDYPGDKAVYKAMTGAAKYAYASALGIPFGDDPEAETGGAGQARKPAAGAEASPAQKRAITTILNQVGMSDETQAQIVGAFGGKPLSKSRASDILDIIGRDATGTNEEKVAKLMEAAKAEGWEPAGPTGKSDVPGGEPDPEPPAAMAELAKGAQAAPPDDAEREAIERAQSDEQEPTLLEDRDDAEKA